METNTRRAALVDAQAGFTLVEVLAAVVVLSFGLMAVTNLLLVAASSTSVANQGSAAVNSATRALERLRAESFGDLPIGGETWSTQDGGKLCNDPDLELTEFHCTDNVPGVGQVHTHWWITETTDLRLLHIRVQSEGMGALSGARSRANFTTFRSCTDADPVTGGCPVV